MNRWETRNGGRFCVTHERLFGVLETCVDCNRDPGDAPTCVAPTEVDKETQIALGELTSVAKYLRGQARKMCDEGTPKDKVNAMKIYDVALKYERAAMETRQRILDREHDRWLVEQNRLLGGGASH